MKKVQSFKMNSDSGKCSLLFLKNLLFCLIFFLIVFSFVDSDITENKPESPRQKQEDDIIAFPREVESKVISCQKIPALSVVLIRLDDTGFGPTQIYRRAIGLKRIQLSENNNGPGPAATRVEQTTTRTRFCVGHLTNTFLVTLFARLVDQKKLDWNTKIMDLLPPSSSVKAKGVLKTATVRDILSHRTGLPSYENFLYAGLPMSNSSRLQTLIDDVDGIDSVSESTNTFQFRTGFRYNPLLYSLAALVLESKFRQSWKQLLAAQVLQYLKIYEFGFLDSLPMDQEQFAWPHIYFEELMFPYSQQYLTNRPEMTAPADSICISTNDAVNWLRFLLSNGQGISNVTRTFLSEETMLSMFRPAAIIHPPWNLYSKPTNEYSVTLDRYAMGWSVGNFDGWALLAQTGFKRDYRSAIWLLPDLKLGFYVALSGSISFDAPTKILSFLTASILGISPLESTQSICNAARSPTAISDVTEPICECPKMTNSSLQRYMGSYMHPFLGHLTVSTNDALPSGLQITFGQFGLAALCDWPEKSDRFWFVFGGPLMLLQQNGAEFCPPNATDDTRHHWLEFQHEQKNQPIAADQRRLNPNKPENPVSITGNQRQPEITSLVFHFAEPDNPPIFRKESKISNSKAEVVSSGGKSNKRMRLDCCVLLLLIAAAAVILAFLNQYRLILP